MATWNNKDIFEKTQNFNFNGNTTMALSTLFNGTPYVNGQVFCLNQGIIFSSFSSNYATNWSSDGNNVTVTSVNDTWENTSTIAWADTGNNISHWLYDRDGSGYHEQIVPSGYCDYAVEIITQTGAGNVRLYHNDTYDTINCLATGTAIKTYGTYYNPRATSTRFMCNFDGSVNVRYIFISSVFYYKRKTQAISGKAVVVQNVYGNNSVSSGTIISGAGSGPELPPNIIIPPSNNLKGHIGSPTCYFDIVNQYVGVSYLTDISSIDFYTNMYSKGAIKKASFPYANIPQTLDCGIMDEIQIGSPGHPVTDNGSTYIFKNQSTYQTNVIIYTTGGVPLSKVTKYSTFQGTISWRSA